MTAETQVEMREWLIRGETIADDPAEYGLTVFVRADDVHEIIRAYLVANGLPMPAPSSEDTPPPVRDDAWTDFEWPDWVPAKTQAEIERFWEARAGRDPSAWQRNSHHNKAPHLGEVVTLPAMKLGKEDLRTGRFVFCWNNIGRLIHDDGTVSYVSFGPDWATRYTPLSVVPTPGGAT